MLSSGKLFSFFICCILAAPNIYGKGPKADLKKIESSKDESEEAVEDSSSGSILDALQDILPERMRELYEKRKKKDKFQFSDDFTLFFWFPNAASLRPITSKRFKTDGFIPQENLPDSAQETRHFRPFSSISIAHIYYPVTSWSWGLYFSPSINYYSWKNPGNIKFVHYIFSAKLLFNLPKKLGTLKTAIGIGPMWLDGEIFGADESNRLTFSPRLQIAYYKFITSRIFVQLKYSKHYLLEDMFEGRGFSVKNFSVTGLYIGWYFGEVPILR